VADIGERSWAGWVTLVARLVLGGSMFYAGALKIGNLKQSVTAVEAYQLPFPDWFEKLVGYCLPVFELVVGAAVILGLFTRWTSVLLSLLLVAYIIGLSQAMARGLQIDCGCFTEGGALPDGEESELGISILRDIGFLAAGVWAIVWPKSPVSLDKMLFDE
jgi:uncharacterized membrane protein YphA (DoxX/SURF4 family)